jgi:molybdopterin converting factor small subunit
MVDTVKAWKISILFFGPLREFVQQENIELTVLSGTTIEEIINQLNLNEWKERGLNAAINGAMCGFDSILHDGAEVAFLPPVSGG